MGLGGGEVRDDVLVDGAGSGLEWASGGLMLDARL